MHDSGSEKDARLAASEKLVQDNSSGDFGAGVNGFRIVEEPADMVRRVPGKLSFWTLLVVVLELCERLAYYGATLMFSIYLQEVLGRSKSQSVALNRVNQFMSYATTIFGAIVADKWLGKFKTIILFSLIYLIGLVVLTISSADFSINGGFGLAGFCIAIPVGFTATKVPGVYEDSKLTTERSFRYFYWATNIGGLAGLLACPQVAKHASYPLAYMIPAIAFAVGIAVFMLGTKKYVKKQPQGTVLAKVWHCMWFAWKNRRACQSHWLDGALGAGGDDWNDEFVIGLQRSLRACKVFLFYPVYWALYGNMSDNFINQGMTTKRPDWLSVDQLYLVNGLVLIIAIPLFDNFIFPLLRRMGLRMGPITRITIGFIIVVCGFIYVTVLQKIIYTKGPYYDFTGPNVPEGASNDISVWYQIVPYAAVGISEIFSNVTGLEYAYSQAPTELKSTLTSLFLFTNCGGALIGMILAIWGGDPDVLYMFAAKTAILGVLAGIFYYCFRHYDEMIEQQEMLAS
ncbi:hypothetical protein H4R19_000296 [Coemansia spiralis]|nr:hypothetical protein H4R19_000296 [Coemansia spiralis]